jgi:hypothetical protein
MPYSNAPILPTSPIFLGHRFFLTGTNHQQPIIEDANYSVYMLSVFESVSIRLSFGMSPDPIIKDKALIEWHALLCMSFE